MSKPKKTEPEVMQDYEAPRVNVQAGELDRIGHCRNTDKRHTGGDEEMQEVEFVLR